MRFSLVTPPDFEFRSAVCSHGFFMLAPNTWAPARRSLTTVITLDDERAVTAVIAAPRARSAAAEPSRRVIIRCDDDMSPMHQTALRCAVRRMLRLDENLSAFHRQCRRRSSHHLAAELRFGRLLRSASLFEDAVKVICTCNVTWSQTVTMLERIVTEWGVPAGDARRGFPTPSRLARVRLATLQRKARVGYRAAFIHRLARSVAAGDLDLGAIERFDGPSDALFRVLRGMHGVGDYGAAHLCMLLGRYDRLAVDTEMVRFFAERHGRRLAPATLKRHYDDWHPHQFLAYWFELWRDYVERHGEADQWSPQQTGSRITARPRHPEAR